MTLKPTFKRSNCVKAKDNYPTDQGSLKDVYELPGKKQGRPLIIDEEQDQQI